MGIFDFLPDNKKAVWRRGKCFMDRGCIVQYGIFLYGRNRARKRGNYKRKKKEYEFSSLPFFLMLYFLLWLVL